MSVDDVQGDLKPYGNGDSGTALAQDHQGEFLVSHIYVQSGREWRAQKH